MTARTPRNRTVPHALSRRSLLAAAASLPPRLPAPARPRSPDATTPHRRERP